MLLFMMTSKCEQRFRLPPDCFTCMCNQIFDVIVYILAVLRYISTRGAGEETPLSARMPRTEALVVGVEKYGEGVVERCVFREEWPQKHCLKKPRAMRQV